MLYFKSADIGFFKVRGFGDKRRNEDGDIWI